MLVILRTISPQENASAFRGDHVDDRELFLPCELLELAMT